MSTQISTKEKLLHIIDDIELISKEIIENAIAPKHLKLAGPDYAQLTDLLVAKNAELTNTLALAAEQAQIEAKMDTLRAEARRRDADIGHLQRQLKEAEQVLATAIYQAGLKLQSIARANRRPVASEELIKFAHRISASNAVCAPLTWQQGDPRRPYPTDIEMRLGLLGRLMSDPVNGHLLQGAPEVHREAVPAAGANQFAWRPTGEMVMSVGGASVAMERGNHKQETEDVEVMSTDSSSSSSSDSQ